MGKEQPFIPVDVRTALTSGGVSTVDEFVHQAQLLGLGALGVADRTPTAWAQLDAACRDADIQPILGMEVDVTHPLDQRPHRSTLVAATPAGIGSLWRLSEMPYIDVSQVAANTAGVIAIVPPESAEFLVDVFDNRRLFVEVRTDGGDQMHQEIAIAMEEAVRLGRAPIASNRVWMAEDRPGSQMLSLLLYARANHITLPRSLVDHGRALSELSDNTLAHQRMRDLLHSGQFDSYLDQFRPRGYMTSSAQIQKRFGDQLAPALRQTREIARMVETGRLSEPMLPAYPVPEGSSAYLVLRERCMEHLVKRFKISKPEQFQRLEHELDVIGTLGLADHFLIASDIVGMMQESEVAFVGVGSATGSFVCYLLGITQIDPLAHGLSFERFLTQATQKIPDIDWQVDGVQRDGVVQRILQEFPQANIYPYCIATYPTYRVGEAVHTVLRMFGFSQKEIRAVQQQLKKDPKELLQEHQPYVAIAAELASRAIPTGSQVFHPSKVIFAGEMLDARVTDAQGVPIVDMDKDMAAYWSNLDFLRNYGLTVIASVYRELGEKISIPLDDPQTLAMIFRGDTDGVPFLSTSWLKEVLQQFGNLEEQGAQLTMEDIVIAFALSRPAAGRKSLELYLKRKSGRESVPSYHPILDEILGETMGVLLYQEQVLAVAERLAGFSPTDAEALRRAISKQREPGQIEAWRQQFVEGAIQSGLNEAIAQKLFTRMTQFVEYGFIKGHAMALMYEISYVCAYLKCHYPKVYRECLREIPQLEEKMPSEG